MKASSSADAENPARAHKPVTKGVKLLMGDPKVAIRRLSAPMIVAMLLMAIYNLADAIWVAGLGADALAGVGFVMPLFMILVGLSNGLGAGATSLISRRIGAGDREGAANGAMHAMAIALAASLVLMLLLVALLEPILVAFGASAVLRYALEYGRIVFLGTVFFLLVQMSYAILRAEGDTRRTMYAMAVSSVLNMVLDPLFIYGAGMGVAGAAIATVLSIASVMGVIAYWFFVRRDTYVRLSPRSFSCDAETFRAILVVGLPASIEFLLMSVMAIALNAILVHVAGTDAVAVYTSGWRIVMFAIVPLVGIATSVIAVTGAAYGARDYRKIQVVHTYSVTLGILIGVLTSTLTFLLAPWITLLFTYTPESVVLAEDFLVFFRTMCLFYPFVPLGMFSSSLFQGTGRGILSLFISFLRTLAYIVPLSLLLGVLLDLGATGVYLGIVLGNVLGGFTGVIWARAFIGKLVRLQNGDPEGERG